MPVHPDYDLTNLYFVTTSAVQRAHLLRRDVMKRIVADSLDYIRSHQWISLYAFVVMPNHVHLVCRFLAGHVLSDVMRDFKKHVAKQIIRHYQAERNDRALACLRQAAELLRDQEYKVWEEGYDARDVFSAGFLKQKIEYVHENPCQPHWALAERPEDCPWSSARFYLLSEPAVIAVDDASV